VTGPKDVIKGLLGLKSVIERLDVVEATVRDLAVTKDEHGAALEAVVTHASRLDQLQHDVETLRHEALLRRYFRRITAFDPATISMVVHTSGNDAAAETTVGSITELLGTDHPPVMVDSLRHLTTSVPRDRPYVMVMRAGDRLAHGWLPVAVDHLESVVDAAGAYGERIDIVASDRNVIVGRFEPSFSTATLLESACIDLGAVVLRRSALVDVTADLGPLDGWDLVLEVAHHGRLDSIPVTASIGPAGPPSTADELARFRKRWPALNPIVDSGPTS
jgi:hypothetical protein